MDTGTGRSEVTHPSTFRVGRRFEELAAEHLRTHGWTILDRNVRQGREEIDLVVRQDRIVAFVEVRGRSSAEWGHPLETVGPRKMAAIRRVAGAWVDRNGRPGIEYRFDVVSVLPAAAGWQIEHVPDAFRGG